MNRSIRNIFLLLVLQVLSFGFVKAGTRQLEGKGISVADHGNLPELYLLAEPELLEDDLYPDFIPTCNFLNKHFSRYPAFPKIAFDFALIGVPENSFSLPLFISNCRLIL